MKIVAQNKKAYHDYFILDTYEAGIELQGTEIKSIRKGSVNLKDSFIRIRNDEAFIDNMHIAPYEQGNRFNHEPDVYKRQAMDIQMLTQQDKLFKPYV